LVVAEKMTERYFLNELDPSARDEFEEHYFNCPECAVNVYAAALLVEEIESGAIPDPRPNPVLAPPIPTPPGWLAWLRPTFVVPVMAMLLAVVGYQGLAIRELRRPDVTPFATVNLNTYGSSDSVIPVHPGHGVSFILRISEDGYTQYTADLYSPAEKLEGSVTIPASSTQDQYKDQYLVEMRGVKRETGVYTVKVRGETSGGGIKDVGQGSLELQIEK